MEEKQLNIRYQLIKLILCVILSVLIFIFRETLITHIHYFIGGLVLTYGLEELFYSIVIERKNASQVPKTYLSFTEIIIGVVLLLNTSLPYESVCIIWAIWAIIRESYEIYEIVNELNYLLPRILSGLESLVAIILSVMLILEAGEHHAMIHLYFLIVELIFTPLVPLIDELLGKRKQNK